MIDGGLARPHEGLSEVRVVMSVTVAFLFALVTSCLAWVLHLVMQEFPGDRRRYLFCTHPLWLWRFINGELSVCRTFLQGGLQTASVAWGLCAMGLAPTPSWLTVLQGAWSILLGFALLNAGRKSQLEGVRSIWLAALIAVLLVYGSVSLRLWIESI